MELRKRIIIIFIGILLSCQLCLSGNEVNKSYKVESVKYQDKIFNKLIKNVLRQEKECSYYSDSLSYGIWLTNRKDTLIITFEGNSSRSMFLDREKLFGTFKYQLHDFFIYGDTLPSLIFRKTNKCKIFFEKDENAIIEDDSWSIYSFFLHNSTYYIWGTSRRGVLKK